LIFSPNVLTSTKFARKIVGINNIKIYIYVNKIKSIVPSPVKLINKLYKNIIMF
jgi:hypothetical protein